MKVGLCILDETTDVKIDSTVTRIDDDPRASKVLETGGGGGGYMKERSYEGNECPNLGLLSYVLMLKKDENGWLL